MYPPPSLEIIKGLTRSDLESLCYGLCTVSLRFENNSLMSFSAPFRFAERTALVSSPIFEFPLFESELMRVIGCQVIDLECDHDGTLGLLFSNDDKLVVYANSPAYEAYTLKIDGKKYIV